MRHDIKIVAHCHMLDAAELRKFAMETTARKRRYALEITGDNGFTTVPTSAVPDLVEDFNNRNKTIGKLNVIKV